MKPVFASTAILKLKDRQRDASRQYALTQSPALREYWLGKQLAYQEAIDILEGHA